jgi:hypothetical protein
MKVHRLLDFETTQIVWLIPNVEITNYDYSEGTFLDIHIGWLGLRLCTEFEFNKKRN